MDTLLLGGGVTTFESLWMGVPVVALEGVNLHQRVSSSILHHAGLHELVSTCEEDMVQNSLRIAKDTKLRSYWRRELRANLLDTDLFKPEKTAKSLVSTLRKAFLSRQ